jgi:hypothetical protein
MTKIIKEIFHNFSKHLSKVSKIDGRFLLLALLLGYFLPLFFAVFSNSYSINSKWIYPLVPKLFPPFADMRVVTSGSECIRLGYDVLVKNPCDPWNRPMNYPRILGLPSFFGLDQTHTVILGILSGLLFFILTFVIIERLSYLEALIYGVILCSPSVMLAIERGNIDLIIYTLLSISLMILKSKYVIFRICSYGLILFAAILKLYPIVSLLCCLKEKKNTFLFVFFVIFTIFGIYVTSDLQSLKLISDATPRPTFLGYGGMVILDIIFKGGGWISIVKKIIFFLLIALVFLIAYLEASKRNDLSQDLNLQYIDGFRMGASLYLGTYLLGNNWDYRLIILLFSIPQMLAWIKSNNQISIPSLLAIIGISLTLWISSGRLNFFNIDELLNWLLLLYFIYALILTLPQWIKFHIFDLKAQ